MENDNEYVNLRYNGDSGVAIVLRAFNLILFYLIYFIIFSFFGNTICYR